MAQYIEFKQAKPSSDEALRHKLEAAPLDHATALLKAYELLDIAEKHGVLDVLKGVISAENTIIEKAAGYANTPEGINTMRNLLVAGRVVGSIDPDVLREVSHNLMTTVTEESRKKPVGFFATARRMFGGDALRGLSIAISALESLGKTARRQAEK